VHDRRRKGPFHDRYDGGKDKTKKGTWGRAQKPREILVWSTF